MDWLPSDPDALLAAVILFAGGGAFLLVLLSRFLLWLAERVSPSEVRGFIMSRILAPSLPEKSCSAPEPEPEQEPEQPEPAAEPAGHLVGKLYSAEQIINLKAQAADRGAALALGRLIGSGMLDPARRVAAMELLFGPRGRRHQIVRGAVDRAIAEAAKAAEPARLVPVNDGERGHVEM